VEIDFQEEIERQPEIESEAREVFVAEQERAGSSQDEEEETLSQGEEEDDSKNQYLFHPQAEDDIFLEEEEETEYTALPSEFLSNPQLNEPLYPGSSISLKHGLLMFLRTASNNQVQHCASN